MEVSCQPLRVENPARFHQLLLRFDQQNLARAMFGVSFSTPNSDEPDFDNASAAEPPRRRWAKNSAAMASPAPLIDSGSNGVRSRKRPAAPDAICRWHCQGSRRSVPSTAEWTQAAASRWPPRMPAFSRYRDRRGGRVRTGWELRHRRPRGTRAHEFRDAALHIDAGEIADHRIAAIARLGIGALHARDRVENRLADFRRTHIAGEHAVTFAEHAARLDALHHIADMLRAEHFAVPGAVAGMVGVLHGVDRPDLDSDPLQRKHRGRIADMAVSDMRLDGEDVHARDIKRLRSFLRKGEWH